ncbi:serine/threonine protein kinase [Pseudenhygromyxa sp. WMMC2535]|uniref:serine/threonine-protein kinase n=1 Tax=Pseudenhygromyxa sp. WMMC2535 TaxID=2712867 RepID=UPI001557F190|nr:serine/threonine-protein kinase [Pseudenhygromyxa sp. WMMC2535]NVB40785.1 serine/threonine protein kinase [Pseudenhygromyxa sp. WMMC2535]
MEPVIPESLLRPPARPARVQSAHASRLVTPSFLVDPEDDRLVAGTMLAHTKQYRVEGCIGEGGMGWVYKAWDPVLERAVAVKVMKPEVPESERDRFRREAVWGARFCHPAIARVFDLVGVPGQGISWFVMEYLPGRDLGTLITRAKARGATIPLRLVIDVFRQILSALQYSHECKVVHRDVKPENMFVTRDPNTRFVTSKLLDFGVALDRSQPPTTPERHLVGDPRYIAPEQSERGRRVDARADVYAAGMSLYEALSNRHPFADLVGGPFEALLAAQRTRKPMPVSTYLSDDLPPTVVCGLDVVIAKATAKDPDDRFESARAMLEAMLEAVRS